MFQLIWSCISQLWELLRESMSYTNNSQTPSSSPSDSMPCTTTSQAPSSSVSDPVPSTSISQIPSSSPSESMASTTYSQTQYDVFLSFRGKDTRLNFTAHLHDKLVCSGIQTFMDDPDLRSGDVISHALVDAIRKSKAYIVVLSENYASSSWCLDELVEIFNCHKTAQRWVIPVFYKIDPSVIRRQIGSFKQAFKKHQVRVELEKVNNWRFTLTQVADFSGFHICQNTSEADIINKIVDELLLKINPRTLDVTRYPVGLDSRVKAITTLLSNDTKGVIKFGIYGMGGVGKTTLAKALFNQLVRGGRFKGSCFLANVRENSGTEKGLVSLQKQLINDVLRSTTKVEVPNVDQGIELIEARICSTKVVVVIDDLDDLKHFQSLVGPFASGTVVIITTRDEEILDKTEVETRHRYMVDTLDDADSLALFTRHAFGNAEPNDNLMGLSKDILHLAGGLPLALEVFGSHLYTRPEVGWKSYIEKLQRSPNSSIQQRLEISLDALESDDPVLKKMFLDIACFFIGRPKQDVVDIMESCYSYADHLIDVLKKRCLLTINDGWLEMHDLLQEVGKEIVRKSSPDEPAKRSRLWVLEDICDVLKNHNGTEAIECIIYRDEECAIDGVTFTTDTFKRMSKLRFLKLGKVNLTGSFEQIFKDLRWLHWYSCSLKCLPSEFYPQKLVILELPWSNMRTMWELNMASHVFGKLKTLNMSYSRNLSTTADFTRVPCLETLNLGGCKSLEEVHMSIGSLANLVSLDLHSCVKLRSLPDSICNLRALKVLIVSRCNSLEALPIQLGNIESLTKLNAGGLPVSKLPDSVGNLTKLVELDLSDNENLETFPDSICNLRSLEILEIRRCNHLLSIPKLPPNLKCIYATRCESLARLPNLSNLKHLELLELQLCRGLTEILGLEKLTALRKLDAIGARLLKKLPDIGSSQKLQYLNLSYSGITALPSGFSQLSNLEELHLGNCDQLLSIPKLPPNLKCIDASGCKSLERSPNLSNLKHLETLDLRRCLGLTEILDLEELTALRKLDITECRDLTYIQGLEALTSITILRSGVYFGRSSLAENHLTKGLFQTYSELGHEIRVEILESVDWYSRPEWYDWIIESPYWTSPSSKSESTVSAYLLPNQSHNFMGIILCFKTPEDLEKYTYSYSVKNTTSGFIIQSDSLAVPSSESVMVIVPKSIFSVRAGDHRIQLTADNVIIIGIHLLYKTETKMIVDVHETSFDAFKSVDPALQDIFLDIACFFIRWKKEEVVQILETYYSNVDHNIGILKNRGLLTINDRDELEMNGLLQHIGRKIAHNNSPDEPGRHSRLWSSLDIYDVLKNHKGTEVIEGIVPRKGYIVDALNEESFTLETFKKMRKLRFLCLKKVKVHLTGSFEQTFEDLRWLCWDYCPLKCLPSEFYPPKLVILELRHSTIITMWELNMIPRVFEKLKTLDMSYSQVLATTPDFTYLPYLETLNFKACESLEEVHISIGCLVRLVSLDLHGCVKLRSLPDTICNLRALEVLDISDCSCLEALPTASGNIQSLRGLNAENLNVTKLPDSIGHLGKLVELRLSSNKNLETLPDTICNLRSLEILDISGCEKLEILVDQLCKVTSLRELIAGGATLLKISPHVESCQFALSLQILDLSDSVLTALPPGISQLSNLEDLNLKDCRCLLSIAELPRNLKWIKAERCMSMEILPNLSNLKQLEYLNLKDCTGLTEIQGLKRLASIRRLHLEGCNSSLLASIFTESFFEMYSEFGHPIQISSKEFPDWISQSSEDGSTMSLNLPTNVSPNYLGMILCIRSSYFLTRYSVKNTTSDFVWRGSFDVCGDTSLMEIVPRSIFSVEDGDDRIELNTEHATIHGIHLLCKTEEHVITSQ